LMSRFNGVFALMFLEVVFSRGLNASRSMEEIECQM
jgi:hypothetical protein